MSWCYMALGVAALFGCEGCGSEDESAWVIDERSYNLGGIGAFAEMVGMGVKQLALSAPLPPAEMEAIVAEAESIAESHGAKIFRETDFLVTDLFSANLTEGKDVLLICQDSTYRRYLDLKAWKQRLLAAGRYDGDERAEVARRFGMLLSYPEERIATLLASGGGT